VEAYTTKLKVFLLKKEMLCLLKREKNAIGWGIAKLLQFVAQHGTNHNIK